MDEMHNPYSWGTLISQRKIRLYAGALFPEFMQFNTHVGLCPEYVNERCIVHDIRNAMPLPDGSVDIYQSEDVFEHIEYNIIPKIFNEIHRVLKPNGIFRLSLPDYRCDILRNRCVYDNYGSILFDIGGGGRLENNVVVGGGHVWFPLLEDVLTLYKKSRFDFDKINILHGYTDENTAILNVIDYSLGDVRRTPDHDARVSDPYRPLSMVIDAYK